MNAAMRTLRSFGLPSLLLLIVLLAHYGADPIGGMYEPARQLAAAKAWRYVLGGVEVSLLYLIVWSLVPWRPLAVRYAASLVCAWGALEGAQIAACRLQFPMDRAPPSTALYTGLCDLITGWPVYVLTCLLVIVVALVRHLAAGVKSDSP